MHPPADANVRPFADIAGQPFCWLWPPWLARGVVTLLDGDPGLGKSTLAVELAAHVSRGTTVRVPPTPVTPAEPEWFTPRRQKKAPPVTETPPPAPPADTRPPQGVLILSAEDDAARVIRPRLEAAAADLDRVFLLEHVPGHPERPLQLPEDIDLLREVTITRIAPVTEQMILSFIAEKLLDQPKSY